MPRPSPVVYVTAKTPEWLGDLWGTEGQKWFWSNIRQEDDKSCWVWPGTCQKRNTYGVATYNKYRLHAHRAALELTLGRKLRPGYLALHACDNPPCANPNHLREGTQADNMRDMHQRERWTNPNPYGEDNRFSKLTNDQVAGIRLLLNEGMPQWMIAKACGVSLSLISKISRNETRKLK